MDKNNSNVQRPVCEQDEYYKEITELCHGVTEAKFYPSYGEASWKCACGHENENALENCEKCSVSRDRLNIVFSELFLIQRRSENEIKRRTAEKRRKEEEAEKWRKIDPEVENIYTEAQKFEETRDNYLAAAEKLEKIKGYKDADELAKEYRELAESAPIYDRKTLKERRNKKIKKTVSITAISAALLLVIYAVLYFTVIAPHGMRYEITDGEVTITSYDTFFGGEHVKIPEKMFGKKVTAIGDYAFAECSAIVSVEIPSTIEIIGQNAFLKCSSLKEIVIPESVTEVASSAFSNCESLKKVEIYGNIDSISIAAFYDCGELLEIIIDAKITKIDSIAFSGCNKLREIKFGGTEEEWSNVSILSGNSTLDDIPVVFEYSSKK